MIILSFSQLKNSYISGWRSVEVTAGGEVIKRAADYFTSTGVIFVFRRINFGFIPRVN